MASAIPVYMKLGREFMPPLYEGTILYMPTTLPGMSVTQAQQLMQAFAQHQQAQLAAEQANAWLSSQAGFGMAGLLESGYRGALNGTTLNAPLLNGKVNAGLFWRLKTPCDR